MLGKLDTKEETFEKSTSKSDLQRCKAAAIQKKHRKKPLASQETQTKGKKHSNKTQKSA